jgi:hypothetical protein
MNSKVNSWMKALGLISVVASAAAAKATLGWKEAIVAGVMAGVTWYTGYIHTSPSLPVVP